MAYRYAASLLILLISAALLAACWDKTEINQLAMVSMVGVDKDPDSGTITAYYQIINPLSGSSVREAPGGVQAPVYTYEIKAQSFGEIRSSIYRMLPRKLFVAHYKVLLISERAARQGILDYVNFIEMQPYGRASIPILIVDGSISDFMKTSTPLEKVPSDSIASRLDMLLKHSLISGKHIRVTDVIERMQKQKTVVLPIITRVGDTSSSSNEQISADIDAGKSNFDVTGGAVLRDYRMIGRLDDEQLVWYHLLDSDRGRHVRRFQLEGKQPTLEFSLDQIRRDVSWKNGQPVIRIHMDVEVSTALASEYVPKSRDDVKKMENQLNQVIAKELLALYQMSREREWDLLGIRDLLRRKMPDHPNIEKAEKNAKVTIHVSSRLKRMGNMKQLYERTG